MAMRASFRVFRPPSRIGDRIHVELESAMADGFLTEIHYLVATPDWRPEDATPLAGFSPRLALSSELIRRVALLPANVYELCPEYHLGRITSRVCGTSAIQFFPQSPRAIMSEPMPLEAPFSVIILGPGQSVAPYQTWLASCPIKPIVVAEKDGTLSYAEFDVDGLQKALLTTCDAMMALSPSEAVADIKRCIGSWSPPAVRRLDYTVGGHATVTPNLIALSVLGFDSPVTGRFKVTGNSIQPYVDQIVQTTRSVLEERAAVPETLPEPSFPRPPALTLFAPAVYPQVNALKPVANADELERRNFRIIKNMIQRQRGYAYDITTEAQNVALTGKTVEEAKSGTGTFKPNVLMQTRQIELQLTTAVMEILTASEISAVARLPNDINRTGSAVRQFSNHYRMANRSDAETLADFRAVQARISQAVPPEFLDLIRDGGDQIRIVADAHLEWLEVDGLPLCLRKQVSRVPVTPGNLFVSQIGAQQPIRIVPEAFKRVLVLSALKTEDQIRGMFEAAFATFGKLWKDKFEIIFKEVGSADELADALNAFDGAIAIFDGHGTHDRDKPAVLMLKDQACDVWSLRDRIKRAPPIMILSACDTHAADRNHATTANGFLMLGCRTVLASVFPLEAMNAATFAARLLYRLAEFVPPMINAVGRAMTWAEICSGMIRMQAATDLRHELLKKRLVTDAQMIELGEASNRAINLGDPDPFATIEAKVVELGLEENRAKRELQMAIAGSSAISYLQMGRPETILFDTPERLASEAAEMDES